MLRGIVPAVLVLVPFACTALGQSSDLSILAGAYIANAGVDRWPAPVSVSTGASVQLGYGHKLLDTPAGNLHLDVPLAIAMRQGEEMGRGFSLTTRTNVFFTPGVRFMVAPRARLTPFVVLGAGAGTLEHAKLSVGPGVGNMNERIVSPVLGFGCGADLRMTRVVSLRAEVRDYVSRAGLRGTEGRHHPVVGVGLGFRF